jgi:nicotinate-nucleotide pyrophosphorylase (carboxylating)
MRKEFAQVTWDAAAEDDCRQLIRLAMREDLGRGHDWTTVSLVPPEGEGKASLLIRQPGAVAGLIAIPVILDEIQANLRWHPSLDDGAVVPPMTVAGTFQGSVRDLLVAERPILNLFGHLSGIATLTHHFVQRAIGTRARVYDTRKTIPGYRRLAKYAVRCGGGRNHRMGLSDAVLIKDNHLGFGRQASGERSFTPAEAVLAARRFLSETLPTEEAEQMIVEIEVDTLQQLAEVLPAQPDLVLLDNMNPTQLSKAVQMRDSSQVDVELEASGGVNLQTVRAIAESGVDRISVGSLTHSAPGLDVGLDWTAD